MPFRSQLRDFQSAYRGLGTVTSFIIINGLVIAFISFVVLHFTMGDLKALEARKLTRDILRATELSLATVEKNVVALGYFYTSVSAPDRGVPSAHSMYKLLTGGDPQITSVLWATDSGLWQYEDLQKQKVFNSQNAPGGLPGYAALEQKLSRLDYNQVGYVEQIPDSKSVDDTVDKPVSLALKIRQQDGSTGVLLAITTPGRIFGNSWSTQREEVGEISISDRDTGFVLVTSGASAGKLKERLETVSYVLQLGEKYWDIKFGVRPTVVTEFLTLSPWLALALVLLLTSLAAFIAERKNRQDKVFAEMSKNLEGAHTELQSKITERDRLFHALRKSEREYRAVINAVSDVIFETDENGRIMFLNETWKRMMDREVQETLGTSLFEMIDPAERVRQKDMFEELVRGERQAYRSEARLSRGGSDYKAVEMAFSMLRMTEDKSLRVVGTITDIEKRRRAELALREAEQRFRSIFENSVSGIYQSTPDGRFISANPALAEMLGYSSTEDLIACVTDSSRQVYADPEARKKFIQDLLFEGRVAGMESEVYRKDGSRMWIMENARVVRSGKGGVDCYEGSIWDVTERRRAEEAMRQARLQAEISSRSRMEFLANMSHELRTPLNAVIGFSEIIKDEVMGPLGVAVYKEYAQDIYESGNYLLKVISEILEVSRIETGNRELTISNFRLQKAIKSCMTIISARVEQAGVEVKVDLPEDLPELAAEELGFKQILLNLIGNAIKFTPKGGNVRVSAKLSEAGDMVIDITDTGAGMSADEIEKAMQPFGKVDTNFSTMKAGTGLGLTIVDSLVRLHGGQFRLISQKGQGTTARVIMPAFRVMRQQDGGVIPLKVVK